MIDYVFELCYVHIGSCEKKCSQTFHGSTIQFKYYISVLLLSFLQTGVEDLFIPDSEAHIP
jgi:hypothetical protein